MSNWIDVNQSVYIARSPAEVYRIWRDVDSLPLIMSNVRSVTETKGKITHWEVTEPGGDTVQWDAEITSDEPGRQFAWATVGQPDVQCIGAVRFEPAIRGGCQLNVSLTCLPTASVPSEAVATLFGDDAEEQIKRDLLRFKEALEAGTFGHAAAVA